ncbi:hypothetical protein TNIN_329031 [Trichonephila inaurata madagascariensis]|uniref:Uncharacterized protein n=1 Tax=Trichonephila inaurata madagascariensis TaxID=2747483 RepID=A0A8X6IKS6_9ARAC|nr:hypothetical protein TNIN_329031 [Trichonephila inaurata madagascariensis]
MNIGQRWTIQDIMELSEVIWNSVQRILTKDLGIKRVAAKFIPLLLNKYSMTSTPLPYLSNLAPTALPPPPLNEKRHERKVFFSCCKSEGKTNGGSTRHYKI